MYAKQKRHDSHGRGRQKARKVKGHFPRIDGMESIHVFGWQDRLQNFLVVDVVWQRQLHDESINIDVEVQFMDNLKQFFLGNVQGALDQGALKANPCASFDLVADIGAACGVVSDKDSSQMWPLFSRRKP